MINFENPSGKNESENSESLEHNIESTLFNERIGEFNEEDLTRDDDGSWTTFEQKVRDIFPEISEDRFKAIKAAVTMHLCGL